MKTLKKRFIRGISVKPLLGMTGLLLAGMSLAQADDSCLPKAESEQRQSQQSGTQQVERDFQQLTETAPVYSVNTAQELWQKKGGRATSIREGEELPPSSSTS